MNSDCLCALAGVYGNAASRPVCCAQTGAVSADTACFGECAGPVLVDDPKATGPELLLAVTAGGRQMHGLQSGCFNLRKEAGRPPPTVYQPEVKPRVDCGFLGPEFLKTTDGH